MTGIGRIAIVWIGILVLVTVSQASAHPTGSAAISKTGIVTLAPIHMANNSSHRLITAYGLPIEPEDSLRYDWKVNDGAGPAVKFEIHTHIPGSGEEEEFYEVIAVADEGTWKVSIVNTQTLMITWINPGSEDVRIAYTFDLLAPPAPRSDPGPAILAGLLLPQVAAFGYLALRLRRRGKARGSGHVGADGPKNGPSGQGRAGKASSGRPRPVKRSLGSMWRFPVDLLPDLGASVC